jgi:hypothetical protein
MSLWILCRLRGFAVPKTVSITATPSSPNNAAAMHTEAKMHTEAIMHTEAKITHSECRHVYAQAGGAAATVSDLLRFNLGATCLRSPTPAVPHNCAANCFLFVFTGPPALNTTLPPAALFSCLPALVHRFLYYISQLVEQPGHTRFSSLPLHPTPHMRVRAADCVI